jgi:predicted nucleic acid-binding protein
LDALHLACAESLRADAFLTTDDRLLSAIRRPPTGTLTMMIANPLAWLTEMLASE